MFVETWLSVPIFGNNPLSRVFLVQLAPKVMEFWVSHSEFTYSSNCWEEKASVFNFVWSKATDRPNCLISSIGKERLEEKPTESVLYADALKAE